MKIAVKIEKGRIRLYDPAEVYYMKAEGDDTSIRTSRKRTYRDPRPLSEWEKELSDAGFFRIHRSYLVNLERVMEIRMRPGDPNDWEVKLEPPVNAVLPVSRQALKLLRRKLGF